MPEVIDTTAWSAALLGLVALFAALGALRKPGAWQTMIGEIEKSPALQLVCGFIEMTAGAAIYLANPWVPADVLACVMKAIGGLMMLEALMVLGFSDLYFQLWLKNLSALQRGWAAVTLVAGLVLAVEGMIRFH